jgi:hypothetical protein
MEPSFDQNQNKFRLTPVQIKAVGVCIGLFLSVLYLVFSLFYIVRWYVQAADWTEIQGTYQRSEVMLGYKLNRSVPLHFTYKNREYIQRVQLSQEQLTRSTMQIGDPTGVILVRLNPVQQNDILVDPRVNIWQYGTWGVLFFLMSLVWYKYFDAAWRVVKKI